MDENRKRCLTEAREVLPNVITSDAEILHLMNSQYSHGHISDPKFIELQKLVLLAVFVNKELFR